MLGIHGGLAMISGRKEWSLDTEQKAFDGKTESEFFAQSIADVSRHYGGDLLDQKTVDWLNLIQCLAIVYGSRVVAIRMTPRARPVRQPTPQETAREFAPPRTGVTEVDATSLFRMNGSEAKPDLGAGEIAGVGVVEFPPDHPLNPNRKH